MLTEEEYKIVNTQLSKHTSLNKQYSEHFKKLFGKNKLTKSHPLVQNALRCGNKDSKYFEQFESIINRLGELKVEGLSKALKESLNNEQFYHSKSQMELALNFINLGFKVKIGDDLELEKDNIKFFAEIKTFYDLKKNCKIDRNGLIIISGEVPKKTNGNRELVINEERIKEQFNKAEEQLSKKFPFCSKIIIFDLTNSHGRLTHYTEEADTFRKVLYGDRGIVINKESFNGITFPLTIKTFLSSKIYKKGLYFDKKNKSINFVAVKSDENGSYCLSLFLNPFFEGSLLIKEGCINKLFGINNITDNVIVTI